MKTKLNSLFVADKIVTYNTDSNIVVTKDENAVSIKSRSIDTNLISPCNHEEADTRMFLHAKLAALGSIKSVNIVSYDTDVLVKGVAVFDELNVDNLEKA